jgi:hypothetical protein
LSFLLGLQSPSELLNSPLLGNLWETWVVNDLLHQQQALGQRNSLYFWRDRSHEVDLVLHRGGRFWLADVKWSEQPDPLAGRPLQKVRGLLPEGAVVDCALLCRASNPYPLNGIQVLPALDAGAWLGLTPAASADPAAP